MATCVAKLALAPLAPLALLGACAAQPAYRGPSMMGLVMLIGVVSETAILLVEDAIVEMTERSLTRFDALIDDLEQWLWSPFGRPGHAAARA